MIGIRLKWECPSCGNIIKTISPFWDSDARKKVADPKRCACGRKGSFKLLNFSKCTWLVLPEGTKVINNKGETVYEEEETNQDTIEESNQDQTSKEDEEEEIKD